MNKSEKVSGKILEVARAKNTNLQKRVRRKQERPGEIIDAGMKEFSINGFAATRLEDVARRAGIAKGTIYRYFDSKEALFEAVVLSRAGPLLAVIEDSFDAYHGSTADLMRMLAKPAMKQFVSSDFRFLIRIILAESDRFPVIAERYFANLIIKGRAQLARLIQRGIERGEFAENAIQKLPMVIVSPFLMAAMWKLTFDSIEPLDEDAMINAYLDMILEGLLKR